MPAASPVTAPMSTPASNTPSNEQATTGMTNVRPATRRDLFVLIRPARTWIAHAEPAAAQAMRDHVESELGFEASVAEQGESATIG